MVDDPSQNQINSLAAPSCAVVLVGGKGTRLQAAVSDRPKVLAPVAGRPFLAYVLDYLASQGITDVILSTGYLAEQISDFIGNGEPWGIGVQYCREDKPLGTAGALRRAVDQYALTSFFALNGDTIFLVDLNDLWQLHAASHVIATLALRHIPGKEGNERGCVRLANDGRIVAFDEKPGVRPVKKAEGDLLASGGVYLLDRLSLRGIEPGQAASIERQVFPHLAKNGRLAGLVREAYFADIGTPASLAKYEKDVITGVFPKSS